MGATVELARNALRLEQARRDGAAKRLRAMLPLLLRRAPESWTSTRKLTILMRLYLGRDAPRAAALAEALLGMDATPVPRDGCKGWSGVEVAPKPKAAESVGRAWDKRLEAEGMPADLEQIRSRELGARVQATDADPESFADSLALSSARWSAGRNAREQLRMASIVNSAVFSAARSYYWGVDWRKFQPLDKKAFRLWAIDGLSSIQIARKLGMAESYLRRIIAGHRARAGIPY